MGEWNKLELPFSMSEYEVRMRNVRRAMEERDLDVLLINDHRNIYYLTGNRVTAFDQYLIIWDGEPINIVRYLEEPSARATSWVKNWVVYYDKGPVVPFDPLGVTVDTLKAQGLNGKKIGLEMGVLSYSNVERFKKLLPDTEIKDGGGIVEKLRLIKSKAEIEYMRRATRINEKALIAAIDVCEVGKSENDIFSEILPIWLNNGSELPKTQFLIGPHSEYQHLSFYGEEARKIQEKDIIFMEFGAFYKRYAGTMSRTAYMGRAPRKIRAMADAVIRGLEKAIEATKPGVTSGEVDKANRGEIAKAGYGEYYRHRTGYSLGIDWYEGHAFSIREGDPAILQPGMVFHYVPAVVVPGIGGVVFRENVLVTEDGYEVLGSLERKLFEKE